MVAVTLGSLLLVAQVTGSDLVPVLHSIWCFPFPSHLKKKQKQVSLFSLNKCLNCPELTLYFISKGP